MRVIVTGASSGIGKELSRKLLAKGASVIGLCRRNKEVAKGVEGIHCDLSKVEDIRSVFSQIDSIDALVNNAGIAYQSRIMDGAIEDWDTMWSVNVRALALCSQLALPKLGMLGQIINVSSMSGHRVPPTGGFYAPTKYAVRAISESLRLELRQQGNSIRVSSVSPGFVETPLLNDYFRGKEDQLKNIENSMQMLKANDVADVIISILDTPAHVEVGDVQLRSSEQSV